MQIIRHFHWFIDGYELSEGGLDFLINEKGAEERLNNKFMEAMDRGNDALYGHGYEWSEEYDSSRGKNSNEDCSTFFEFMCQKQNEILKEVPDDTFELFTDPEFGEGFICGRLKNVHNKNVRVKVTFEDIL